MCFNQWNLVLERIEHSNGQQDTISYVWGKDLSGTPQGAGGIGGLLWMEFNDTLYIPCYDSNGNITQYIDDNGTPVTTFTYDPFGRTTTQTGNLSFHLSFRFSTKYYDPETDLYYFGYRFYSPHLMRWMNRDPIQEEGGKNLYSFCQNNSVQFLDLYGHSLLDIHANRIKSYLQIGEESLAADEAYLLYLSLITGGTILEPLAASLMNAWLEGSYGKENYRIPSYHVKKRC